MNILGISAYYHDSAAALVSDGVIVAAAQEERFTRKKHDAGFPGHAIASCLADGGIELKDVDYITFYDKPLLNSNVCWKHTLHLRQSDFDLLLPPCRCG